MLNDRLSELHEQGLTILPVNNQESYLALHSNMVKIEFEKPNIIPPKEKPTLPNRQIPEHPGKVKEKPINPKPNIPEIKPPKRK